MKRNLVSLVATFMFPITLMAVGIEDSSAVGTAAPTPEADYAYLLMKRIEQNWIFPKRSGGQTCRVRVTQATDGEVTNAQILDCQSKKLANSVYAAVYRASPLPLPADPATFNATLELTFVVPKHK